MQEITLGVIEARFADMIWSHEPISSSELWKMAEKTLGWKKTTTFTVLKRLCEKRLFINEKGIVSSLISKEEFVALQSERFIEDTFDGSLPAFIAAFATRKSLTPEEVAELKRLVAAYEEDP